MYCCYNTEYLFYPLCKTNNIDEILAFTTSEDNNSMMDFVINLYAKDLNTMPNRVLLTDAMIDATGYYALARTEKQKNRRTTFRKNGH